MWFKQLSAPWLTCQMQFLTSGNDKVASSIPMSATAKQTQKNGGVPYPKKLRNNKIHQPNPTQLNPIQPNPTQSNPIQHNSTQSNPIQPNPTQLNPIQPNPNPKQLLYRSSTMSNHFHGGR